MSLTQIECTFAVTARAHGPVHKLRGANFAVGSLVAFDVLSRIPGISQMGEQEFRQFELTLVRLYRSEERSQEGIAMALMRASLAPTDQLTRERLDEVVAMLQHVHDPFITASVEPEAEKQDEPESALAYTA